MKVLIATEKPFAPAAVEGIKKVLCGAGHEVTVLEGYKDKSELIAAVKDVNAMIVRSDKVTKEVIDAAPELKLVVRAGAGYDSIDTAYAKEKGVIVENTPGQNSNAVAELVFGMAVNAIVGTLFVPNFWELLQRFQERYLNGLFKSADLLPGGTTPPTDPSSEKLATPPSQKP